MQQVRAVRRPDGVGAAVIDDEAFATFMREHGRSLFGTAYVLTGDGAQAEELVQDVLVRLLPQWDRVMRADAPLAYVRRAVVNRFVSLRRRPASHETSLVDLADRASPGDFVDVIAGHGLLTQLLATLPERQRAALVLRYLYDWKDAEIGTALGCREGTVRSLLSRALDALRSQARDAETAGNGGGER